MSVFTFAYCAVFACVAVPLILRAWDDFVEEIKDICSCFDALKRYADKNGFLLPDIMNLPDFHPVFTGVYLQFGYRAAMFFTPDLTVSDVLMYRRNRSLRMLAFCCVQTVYTACMLCVMIVFL